MSETRNDSVNDARSDSVSDSLLARGRASADRSGRDRKGEVQQHQPSPARTNGFDDAREQPHAQEAPDQTPPADDEGPWLVGYRIDLISRTTLLLGFKPPITDLLRRKRWAVLITGDGWAIPTTYLAHVEKLLAGANVVLFDVDGAPTPGQREREKRDAQAHGRRVLDEIHAARDDAARNREAVERARAECHAAFEQATNAVRASRESDAT